MAARKSRATNYSADNARDRRAAQLAQRPESFVNCVGDTPLRAESPEVAEDAQIYLLPNIARVFTRAEQPPGEPENPLLCLEREPVERAAVPPPGSLDELSWGTRGLGAMLAHAGTPFTAAAAARHENVRFALSSTDRRQRVLEQICGLGCQRQLAAHQPHQLSIQSAAPVLGPVGARRCRGGRPPVGSP